MDEIVRHMQSCLKKIALDRLRSVSVWMGVARRRLLIPMDLYQIIPLTDGPKTPKLTEPLLPGAKIIEFYIPVHFVRPARWIPEWRRGKVLPFRTSQKKTA